MAYSAATRWPVFFGGNAQNGGGFVTGASGTNFSLQNSPQYALTGVTSAGAGDTVLSVSAAADMVGNYIYVVSGTNFTTGEFQITSVSVGVSITCATNNSGASISTGAGATGVMNVGGAKSTVADVSGAIAVAGNYIDVKSDGTYTRATTITCGPTSKGSLTAGPIIVRGFASTPSDGGTRPSIGCSGSGIAVFTCNDADYWKFDNLSITHTHSTTKGAGIASATTTSTPVWVTGCVFDGCSTGVGAGSLITTLHVIGCEFKNLTTAAGGGVVPSTNGYVSWCVFHDNSGAGVYFVAGTTSLCEVRYSIFDGGTNGIAVNATGGTTTFKAVHCNFYAQGTDGIDIPATSGNTNGEVVNCIFYGITGEGIDNNDDQTVTDTGMILIRNNAFGGNGTNYSALTTYGDITLTGNPWTDAAGGNFNLNNTGGAGAACRGAGYIGAFPGSYGTTYVDVGAIQHQDAGGGGGTSVLTGPGALAR